MKALYLEHEFRRICNRRSFQCPAGPGQGLSAGPLSRNQQTSRERKEHRKCVPRETHRERGEGTGSRGVKEKPYSFSNCSASLIYVHVYISTLGGPHPFYGSDYTCCQQK